MSITVNSVSKSYKSHLFLNYQNNLGFAYVFKKLSLVAAKVEIEKLLLNTFRTATLFTLSYDLLVMVSKTKKVSCRDTAPSFRNKLPEFSQESQEPKELDEPKE